MNIPKILVNTKYVAWRTESPPNALGVKNRAEAAALHPTNEAMEKGRRKKE
jgi:hypothetical protein